jgi:hypothetical protein
MVGVGVSAGHVVEDETSDTDVEGDQVNAILEDTRRRVCCTKEGGMCMEVIMQYLERFGFWEFADEAHILSEKGFRLNAEQWDAWMNMDMAQQQERDVFILVALLALIKALPCRCVYKDSQDEQGEVKRYKAMAVDAAAQGCFAAQYACQGAKQGTHFHTC